MKLWRSLKNHLVPWRGNTHRPRILRRGWLTAILALALLCEGIIVGHTLVQQGPNVFLAAVVTSDVIMYTDEARVREGGQALTENEALDAAAQAKAQDMASKGYFSHVGPDGEQPWSWIERAGYEYVYAGENLAVRFNDSKDVVDAWMASPTHRANIVKPNYKEIGVGLAQGIYKGSRATFVVQYFGSPAKSARVSVLPAAPVAQPVPVPTASAVASESPAPTVAGASTEPAAQAPAPASASAAPAPQQQPAQSAARAITRALSEAPRGASWLLAGIAMLLITVLALTFFVHIQVQPTDLLLPGLAVALIAITLLSANAKLLPAATQSASVAGAGQGDIAGGDAVERMSAFPEAPAQ